LNGLYQEYDSQGRIYVRGNYIQGAKEGDWYTFWSDSTLADHRIYSNGSTVSYEQFSVNNQVFKARPGFNFTYYMLKYLRNLNLPPAHGSVIVAFTITVDGMLTKPEIIMGINSDLDKAILEGIKNSPKWVSAKKDNKRIEQRLMFAFEYDTKD